MSGQSESKEEERGVTGGSEERTVAETVGRKSFKVSVRGDNVRCSGEGGGREKVTKWWSDTGRGVTECRSGAGPCEDKVELVLGYVSGGRSGERQAKCGKKISV